MIFAAWDAANIIQFLLIMVINNGVSALRAETPLLILSTSLAGERNW
jgi:hypothetical protein